MRHARRQLQQPPVRWTDAEWCQIAVEIQRSKPHRNYLDDAVIAQLRVADVMKSQHVLPLARQRRGMESVTLARLHPSLRQAFNTLLADKAPAGNAVIAEESAPAAAPAAVDVAPPPAAAIPPVAPTTQESPTAPVTAAPAPAIAAAPTAAPAAATPPAATINPWEAAFKPLLSPFLNLLTHEVMAQVEQRLLAHTIQQTLAPMVQEAVAQIVPTIAGSVQQVMAQQLAAWEPSIPATPAPALTLVANNTVVDNKLGTTEIERPEPAPATAPVVPLPPKAKAIPAPKRFKIGIMGNRNTYADELAKEFKGFDFICVDNKHQMDRLRGCDQVYFLTRFNEHSNQSKAKALGLNFTYVNGGLSTVKRLLRGLEHDLSQKK